MLINEWFTMWRREFAGYTMATFRQDVLAGITVAAVALPLALAFGVASGADAAAGLVTAVLSGIVIGLLGGAPYQISGPTGAMSAVLIVLVSRYGLEGMWFAALLAGIMMFLLGVFRLGRVVALIPSPVISGFTSGIAIIIAFGQIDNFLGIKTPNAENVVEKLMYYAEHGIEPVPAAIIIALVVIVTMIIWPKFKWGQQVPGSLIGIVLATLLVIITSWNVPTIGNIPRTILLENRLNLDTIPWSDLGGLVVPAMSIAALGAIESLLCGAVAGNMTGIRLNNNLELIAQGIGNIVIPFFGGVPATAAIARTSVNIKSGGITRLVPILHGLTLLVAALLFANIIGFVPLAALAGVLLVTAWRMNEWHTIRFYFHHRLKHAIIAFSITLIATVALDLTQAILIGFGISSLIFMAQMSELRITRRPIEAERLNDSGNYFIHPGHEVAVYYLSGPLFFAAARRLVEFVERHDTPDTILILSVRGVPLIDATGVEVIREIIQRQRRGGGDILLTSMDERVQLLLQRAAVLSELGEDHIFWSADLAITSLGMTVTLDEQRGEEPTSVTPPLMESIMITPFAETMGAEVDGVSFKIERRSDPLAQPVHTIMQKDVITVSPVTDVAEVVSLVLKEGQRSLPVVTGDGEILGIITDGDLLRRANLSTRLDTSTDVDALNLTQRLSVLKSQGMTAIQLMSSPVMTVSMTAPLRTAAGIMVEHHLKRLPVVAEQGRLVGWVSRVDILRAVDKHQIETDIESDFIPSNVSISDLMYRDVPTITQDANVEEILQALEKNGRRRAVVVDSDQQVVGIITDGDILHRTHVANRAGILTRLRSLLSGQPSTSSEFLPAPTDTAAQLMSTPVITISIDAQPNEALQLMLQYGIKRLPVVDTSGKLVGLLGRARLLQGLIVE